MRLYFLDSLRGLAALYVLVYHLALVPTFKPAVPAWLKSFVMFGGTGVTLFFVVSAFSLCLTMPRHLNRQSPLKSFYVSRLFRIAPLFYAMIVLTLVRDVWTFNTWQPMSKVLLSLGMVYNLVPGEQPGFVWASWTIGVEMLFYAAFPFLYWALRTPALRAAAFFAFCLVAFLLPGFLSSAFPHVPAAAYTQYSVLRHLPVFIVGMLAFSAYEWLNQRGSGKGTGIALISFGVLGLTFFVAKHPVPTFIVDGYYWRAIFFAAILIGLSLWPLSAVVNRPTKWTGDLSYSIYLAHAPIIFMMSPVYRWIYDLPGGTTAKFAACFLVTLAVVLPVAWLFYRFIELPGIAAGHRVIANVNTPKPATVSQTRRAVQPSQRPLP